MDSVKAISDPASCNNIVGVLGAWQEDDFLVRPHRNIPAVVERDWFWFRRTDMDLSVCWTWIKL